MKENLDKNVLNTLGVLLHYHMQRLASFHLQNLHERVGHQYALVPSP